MGFFLLAWVGLTWGWWQWRAAVTTQAHSEPLLEQATNLARTIPSETVLTLGTADVSSPTRQRLQGFLESYRAFLAHPTMYVLTRRNGETLLVTGASADGESIGPGAVVTDIPAVVGDVFADGMPRVIGPYTRQGNRVMSAFAPVRDPFGGEVRLVVGVDADATVHAEALRRERNDVLGRSAVLLGVIGLGVLLVWGRPRLAPLWQARFRYAEIYLVAVFGVLVTFTLARILVADETRSRQQSLYRLAATQADLVREAFVHIEDGNLAVIARYMTGSQFVSRNEFRLFAEPLRRHARLIALGWVPSVPADQCQRWEARAHSEGVTDFTIWQVGNSGAVEAATGRPVFYPLWYLAGEPVVGLGFDLASHPVLQAALEKALAEGLSTVTEPLLLPGQEEATMVLLRPVFSGRLLRGLVVAFVPTSLLGDMLAPAFPADQATVVALYELGRNGQALLRSASAGSSAVPPTPDQSDEHLVASFPLFVADRAYVLAVYGLPPVLHAHVFRVGRNALLLGFLFTALFTSFTAIALRTRGELEAQVAARTSELRRHEAYLAGLLDTIGDVVFTVAWPERRITSVNRSVTTVFGYSPAEVIGQSSRLFYLDEADYLAYGRALAEAQAQGQTHVQRELLLRHKDGHAIWAEAHTVFLAPGEWPGTVITLVRDISARKEAEAQLRASEERYRLLFNSMLNGFVLYEVVYDEAGEPTDYRFLEVNPAFERLTGLRGAEIGGRTLREVLPDVEMEWLERYAEAVRTGRPVHFDHDSRPLKRHYEVSAYCPRPGQLVSFFNDVTEREQAKAQSEKQVQRLAALRAIDIATSSTFDLRTVLDVVLQQTALLTPADAAAVWLVESGNYTLQGVVGRGFRQRSEPGRIRFGQGLIGRAVLERRTLSQLSQTPLDDTLIGVSAAEGFVAAYAAPLIAKGEVKGVLAVFCRHAFEPDPDWLAFFEALAGQAAVAVDNAQLLERLQRAHTELAVAYEATIEGWARALDLRDRETEGHTRRVVELSERLAQALGLTETEIVHIRRGALLHDIGKMAVPDTILLKPDRLSPEEEAVMRRHPLFAYEMLVPIAYLRPALDIPHYHHERWNGSGYPYGLKGEQIPLAARLFAVVDVWDALRSDRPYRRAWSEAEAAAYLRANRGVLFDPRIVDAFLQMLASEGKMEGAGP
jgi:PAS domain S-box-containing protein